MIKNLIAVLLIAYGIWGNGLLDILDTPTPTPTPTPPVVVDVNTPRPELVEIVKPIAATVTEADDRARLAVFFLELSKRVKGLPEGVDLQQFNDILVHAAQTAFEGSLEGKYNGLDEGIVKLIVDVTGTKNHALSPEEKKALAERCEALAWALVQR